MSGLLDWLAEKGRPVRTSTRIKSGSPFNHLAFLFLFLPPTPRAFSTALSPFFLLGRADACRIHGTVLDPTNPSHRALSPPLCHPRHHHHTTPQWPILRSRMVRCRTARRCRTCTDRVSLSVLTRVDAIRTRSARTQRSKRSTKAASPRSAKLLTRRLCKSTVIASAAPDSASDRSLHLPPRPLGSCKPWHTRLSCASFAIHFYSGLLSFASTTLILSLVNVQTDGVTVPNIVVGMALFVGGLCQLLAGMWEFAAGNTLGATGELNFRIRSRSFSAFSEMSRLHSLARASVFTRDPADPTFPLLDIAITLSLPPRILSVILIILSIAFSSYGGFWLSFAMIYLPSTGIVAAYPASGNELDNAVGFYLAVWFIFTFIML